MTLTFKTRFCERMFPDVPFVGCGCIDCRLIQARRAFRRWLDRRYYARQRRAFGESYGCGRCHHAYQKHDYTDPQACTVHGCPCHSYSIQRVAY